MYLVVLFIYLLYLLKFNYRDDQNKIKERIKHIYKYKKEIFQ